MARIIESNVLFMLSVAIDVDPTEPRKGHFLSIFIRKEIEKRKLERKSKQQISLLKDLVYRLNDISL